MKVVQVITSADWGGAQRHVADLASELVRRGHTVEVCYGVEGPLGTRLADRQIPVRRIPELTREIHPLRDISARSVLRAELEALNPDVVHVHSSKAGFLVRWALRKSSIPVVYTIHGLVFVNARMSRLKRNFYRTLEQVTLPWSDAVITVSQSDYEHVLAMHPGQTRLVHIPNGILPPANPPPLPKFSVVGTVARFTAEKALDTLIRAVALLPDRVPGIRLLLVGDGPLRPDLEALAEELGIADRVVFAGFQEPVNPWLAHMRVFALPSVKEGMPYALLEAMAAARPVVAADVGGVAEASAGYPPRWLLPKNVSAVAWAEALFQALEDPYRFGLPTPPRFTLDQMADRTLVVYQSVITGYGGKEPGEEAEEGDGAGR